MRAYTLIRAPNGAVHELVHGDLIGRLDRAELRLDDARISEAHAMINLRGGELRMLGLRGRFSLGSGPLSELVLEEGQEILLARGLVLKVEAVVLPDAVMGLEGDGLPLQMLGGTHSLLLSPEPALVRGVKRGAAAVIWGSAEQWRIQPREQPPRDLHIGDALTIAGRVFTARSMKLSRVGPRATRLHGGMASPLRIVARFDTVHIHRDGEPPLTLTGMSARILSELVSFDGPVGWEVMASEIWGERPRQVLRGRLDVSLSRLRNKLRAARIRADLVRSTSTGFLELCPSDSDTVIDET